VTEFLDLDDLLVIATDAIGSPPLVRDYGLLEAALARPAATVFGSDAYPTIHTKAAALLHSLAANHALVDGNKRLALLATYVFLDLNGHELNATQDAAYSLVISVADGTLSDVEKIAERLAAWSRPH
jgi:death on curing protein